jgi:hypothetical protein
MPVGAAEAAMLFDVGAGESIAASALPHERGEGRMMMQWAERRRK